MQESTVYRSIQREVQEERDRTIALNLLREGLSLEIVARTTDHIDRASSAASTAVE